MLFSSDGFMRLNSYLVAMYRVVYLNLLWVATTVLGLGLFGVGPASYALAKYTDGWCRHGLTPPPGRAFLAAVRERTLRSILMSWILLGAGAVIVTNIFFASSWTMQMLNVVALAVLAVATAYVFPVMVAMNLTSIPRQLAAALLVGFGSLHWTIVGATAVAVVLGVLWWFVPLAALIFGVGVPAVAVGLVTRTTFRDLTERAAAQADEPEPDAELETELPQTSCVDAGVPARPGIGARETKGIAR